jgi:hypothetical protein
MNDETKQQAYVYRKQDQTAAQLQALVNDYVCPSASTMHMYAFAASSVERQPTDTYEPVEQVTLAGAKGPFEFGHVFSEKAEVRWKLQSGFAEADYRYDVLLLTEEEQPVLQADELKIPGGLTARCTKQAIILDTPQEVKKQQKRHRLECVEYCAANGAVQFVRYKQIEQRRISHAL